MSTSSARGSRRWNREAKTTPPSSSRCTRNWTTSANTRKPGTPCSAATGSCSAGLAMTGPASARSSMRSSPGSTRRPCARTAADAAEGPVPIFIVGMPRSGTTLLERILGNHSMVMPTGELADFPRQLRWTADLHGHALVDLPLLDACKRPGLRAARPPLPGPDPVARAGPALLRGQAAAQLHAGRLHPPRTAARPDPAHGPRSDGCLLLQLSRAVRRRLRLQLRPGIAWPPPWAIPAGSCSTGIATLPGSVLDIDYDELVRDTEAATRRAAGILRPSLRSRPAWTRPATSRRSRR